MYDPKSLAAKQAHEFAVLARLVPEAMTAPMRTAARTRHHREVIAATLAARFPALASEACALVSGDEGAAALDTIADAIATLHDEDPFLFAPIPSREEMLGLAIRAHDGPLSQHLRSHLWVQYCDTPEERRYRAAYTMRHRIAERGERTAKPAPARERDGGLIDGGIPATRAVADAEEAFAPIEEGAV